MLQNLHVKNLALIDESEVDFAGGLNILSGETGASKRSCVRCKQCCAIHSAHRAGLR